TQYLTILIFSFATRHTGPVCSVASSHRPYEDHARKGALALHGRSYMNRKVSSCKRVNSLAVPPNDGISMTAQVSGPFARRKAIHRPSGDHAGAKSLSSPDVMRTGSVGPISLTYMPGRLPGSCQVNATLVPSGEKLGDH